MHTIPPLFPEPGKAVGETLVPQGSDPRRMRTARVEAGFPAPHCPGQKGQIGTEGDGAQQRLRAHPEPPRPAAAQEEREAAVGPGLVLD